MDITLTPNYTPDGYKLGKTGGAIIRDGKYVADTLQCVHCSAHFEYTKAKTKGYCTQCQGFVCGNPECMEHLPLEYRLQSLEKKKDLNEALKEYDSRTRYLG